MGYVGGNGWGMHRREYGNKPFSTFVLLFFAHRNTHVTYLLQDYFTLPRAHSVGRAGQLNYPKSRYYSWEIIDHRLIAFVTIDYNALDSDYNTTTPKLFRLVHNTFLCLYLLHLIRSDLLFYFSCIRANIITLGL